MKSLTSLRQVLLSPRRWTGGVSTRNATPANGRNRFPGTASLAVMALLLFAGAIDGQQNDLSSGPGLKGLNLEQLGNIVVTTTSKEPVKIRRTPAAIFVLTQEDIRRSGATSIPELLRLVPGVEVARIDSDDWAVGVRGFGSQFSKSLLVLIDGRSVYSPLFAGVYWQVQDTLLEDIDRIEVIRGPGGTIWGANAVNGVINIITKNAKDTHGLISSLGGGDIDQGIAGARFGGVTRGGIDYRVYGKGFIRGPEFHPDGVRFDDWRMGQLGFRADGSRNHDTFNVQGDLYKGLDGESLTVSSYSPPSVAVVNAQQQTSGGNIVTSWRRKFSGNSDIEVRGYYDRTSRFSPQLDELRNTFDLDLLYRFTAKGHQDVLLGTGARWSHDHVAQTVPTLNFSPAEETDRVYSWFAQDQIAIVPQKLSLILGSKFGHNNRSGFEIQPNGRLMWTPTLHQTIWAAVTRAVRTPSRLDQDLELTDFLAVKGVPIFLRVVGTKAFRSENLLGTEAGYRTLIARRLYMDLSLFRNDYNDLYGYGPGSEYVELSPAPAHIILQEPLANALKGDTSGGEIAPDWEPAKGIELKGSYSYLHLYVHDKPGFTDSQNTVSDNGSSPHHQAVIQGIFNFPGGFELTPTYRYASSLPAQNVAAYRTGDVRFSWRSAHDSEAHGWEFSVDGQNLLQPHHAEFGGDPGTLVGIKRGIYGAIAWRQ